MKFPLLFQLIRAANEAPALSRLASAINVAADPAAEWVELRYGVYPNAVGLQVLDRAAAEAMVRTFNSLPNRAADLFRGLPGYVGHPDDPTWRRDNPGVRAEAIGRIKDVQAGEAALRLRVALNDEGRRLVSGPAAAYDSFSPNWGMVPITHQGRKAFRPVELYSIGLTNQPNIPGTFIGLNEALPLETPDPASQIPNFSAMKSKLIALLAALGRPVANADTVSDDQLAAAVNEATPVAAQLVTASNEHATTRTKLATAEAALATANQSLATATNEKGALNSQLSTLNSALTTERAARAELLLTGAINEGRITAAQKPEWLGRFTAAGADFAAVSAELAGLKRAVNTQSKTAGLGARRAVSAESKAKITAINEAVETKKKATGLSHDAAYAAVRREKPELFPATNAE
ncbi:MAG: hypothetical protein HZA93_23820 [Verrucomicrobia bacterium]|nr:hypothetical protein [Verrucomicrobiota bacterium]